MIVVKVGNGDEQRLFETEQASAKGFLLEGAAVAEDVQITRVVVEIDFDVAEIEVFETRQRGEEAGERHPVQSVAAVEIESF